MVPGFIAGAVESAMRYAGRLDLALICAQDLVEGCASFGCFHQEPLLRGPGGTLPGSS